MVSAPNLTPQKTAGHSLARRRQNEGIFKYREKDIQLTSKKALSKVYKILYK